MGTPVRDKDAGIDLKESYLLPPENAQKAIETLRWWTLYDDADLDALMTHAFSNNPSLGQMRAQIRQASALKQKYSAALWPSLSTSATRSTYNGSVDPDSDFDLAGAASYELDLWSKNRALGNAYMLKEHASHEALHAGAITLSANIVDTWLQILALTAQEKLVRSQIETNQTIYELQQKRFEMGTASALDVLQQEESVSASKAALPDILSAQAQAVNALSLLIGEPPSQSIVVHAKPLPEPLPLPESGIPSDLLENRPDIIAAWFKLLSSDNAALYAKASRLPSFDLSAVYAAGETKLSNIFDSWLLTLAGGVTAPVFQGGALEAEQRYQEALADEAFHIYRETVLAAIVDVENALVKNRYEDKKIEALDQQLRAARETLEQAELSYANGQSAYINVLTSLTGVQSLESQIISAQLSQAQARVSLYRALGGRGWEEIIPDVTILVSSPRAQNETVEGKEKL